jgi:hypothetical protein
MEGDNVIRPNFGDQSEHRTDGDPINAAVDAYFAVHNLGRSGEPADKHGNTMADLLAKKSRALSELDPQGQKEAWEKFQQKLQSAGASVEEFVFDDAAVLAEGGSTEPLISPVDRVRMLDADISILNSRREMETGEQASEVLIEITALRLKRDELYERLTDEEKSLYQARTSNPSY